MCISHEWMNKLWDIRTMEYCLFTKRNKVQVHVTTWMNLENILLSERSQIKKEYIYIIQFIQRSIIEQAKIIFSDRNQISGCWGGLLG